MPGRRAGGDLSGGDETELVGGGDVEGPRGPRGRLEMEGMDVGMPLLTGECTGGWAFSTGAMTRGYA